MDFETCELILRMEDKQQSFNMNTPLKQPSYPVEFKKVNIEIKDDYASHLYKVDLLEL